MHYYFASAYPCALKINGIYVNKLEKDNAEFWCSDSDAPLVEMCPLVESEQLKCFILNNDFLHSPPQSVQVTDLKGGYLIHFDKSYIYGQFELLSQFKSHDVAVTVYFENGIKISIETPTDFKVVNLFYDAKAVEIEKVNISNTPLLCVRFIGKKTLFILFSYINCIEQVFYREIDEFSFEENLITIEKIPDLLKHNVKSVWEFNQTKLVEKERIVTTTKSLNNLLVQEIVPYAFLESYLVGGKYLTFLSEEIKKNAHSLKDYLGEFIGVMPPPKFRKENEVGVIKKINNNLYSIDYFVFEMQDGKICNIKKSAN